MSTFTYPPTRRPRATVARNAYLNAAPIPTIKAPAPAPGAWRYRSPRQNRWTIAASGLVSVLLHWFVITDNPKHKPPPIVRVAEEPVILMEMPDIEEEEIPEVVELADEAEAPPQVSVPMLQDTPRLVEVDSFVQPLQVTPDYKESLNNAKLSAIPVGIARGNGKGGVGDGKVFDLSQLDRQPVPVTQVPPEFPHELKRDTTTGRATVEFIVSSQGDVLNVSVIDASHPGFGTAAIAGVSKWKFRPGMKAGRKVNVRVRIPIVFQVTDEEK